MLMEILSESLPWPLVALAAILIVYLILRWTGKIVRVRRRNDRPLELFAPAGAGPDDRATILSRPGLRWMSRTPCRSLGRAVPLQRQQKLAFSTDWRGVRLLASLTVDYGLNLDARSADRMLVSRDCAACLTDDSLMQLRLTAVMAETMANLIDNQESGAFDLMNEFQATYAEACSRDGYGPEITVQAVAAEVVASPARRLLAAPGDQYYAELTIVN